MFRLFRRTEGAKSQSAPLVMTTTNELFLPSRIVYRVFDREAIEAKFQQLRCISRDQSGGRWTWEYDHEAKRMGFPSAYEELPPEHQPVVLASGYWVDPAALHVYVRSTLRLTKFLLFFDQQVPRAWARGEFLDAYNLLTVHDPRQPLPRPEDYFLDESRLAFFDAAAAVQDSRAAELMTEQMQRTLEPLVRHPLTAFYEDGEAHLTGAMQLRELLAMKQHQSVTPIRPYDVILESLRASESAPAPGPKPPGPQPTTADPVSTAEVASPLPSGDGELARFSFARWDPTLKDMVWDVPSTSGPREQYLVRVGCCENPFCDCRVLEVWLRPLPASGPSDEDTHFRLLFDQQEVTSPSQERPRSQRLARAMGRQCTSEDWLLAETIYHSDKADFSEPTEAPEGEVLFPAGVLADPTVLIQYQEVFPYARTIRFETEGRLWVVFERYCSNPDCDCTTVLLDIARIDPGQVQQRHRAVQEGDVTGIEWDYAAGRLKTRKPGPAGSPSPARLLQALKAANPDLEQRVRRRQGVLRQLHAKARSKPPQTRVEPSRPPPKVGRNDPCPCGSGLKFKKCCGKN